MQQFTEQQRENAQKVAKEKRVLGQELYRNDFMDDEHWKELALRFGVLLPKWYVAPEVSKMRSWIRKLGLKERDYCEACGEDWQLSDFAKLNPDWPLRAFVGILLEYVEELNNAKEINIQHTHRRIVK